MADTTIVSVAASLRQPNTYTFTAPQPILQGAVSATFTLSLLLADKLAVGKSLAWLFETSPDGTTWTMANKGGWSSYGPGGVTLRDPRTGQPVTNPDHALVVPLTGRSGQRVRGSLVLSTALSVGVVIELRTA